MVPSGGGKGSPEKMPRGEGPTLTHGCLKVPIVSVKFTMSFKLKCSSTVFSASLGKGSHQQKKTD